MDSKWILPLRRRPREGRTVSNVEDTWCESLPGFGHAPASGDFDEIPRIRPTLDSDLMDNGLYPYRLPLGLDFERESASLSDESLERLNEILSSPPLTSDEDIHLGANASDNSSDDMDPSMDSPMPIDDPVFSAKHVQPKCYSNRPREYPKLHSEPLGLDGMAQVTPSSPKRPRHSLGLGPATPVGSEFSRQLFACHSERICNPKTAEMMQALYVKKEETSNSMALTRPCQDISSKPRRKNAGENRLRIDFESFGELGRIPQLFGRLGHIIPDGLCGRTQLCQERWHFEIKHHARGQHVVIEWTIQNLSSGKISACKRENIEDSIVRHTQGKTISNVVLKAALDDRALEFEREVKSLNASLKEMGIDENVKMSTLTSISNLEGRIKILRPKRCNNGSLFFGLQHQSVQCHFQTQLATREATNNSTIDGQPSLNSGHRTDQRGEGALDVSTSTDRHPMVSLEDSKTNEVLHNDA